MELPKLPFERIVKKKGNVRVSAEACKTFRDLVEKHCEKIAEKAIKIAKHTGRKTVKPEDIEFAINE